MTKCEVHNCQFWKRKSVTFFHSPRHPKRLELWKKILNISKTEFQICDVHFEEQFIKVRKLGVTSDAYPTLFIGNTALEGGKDFCQCCLVSLNDKEKNFYQISEQLQRISEELLGCQLKQGLICSNCYNCMTQFHTFRDNIRTIHEMRKCSSIKEELVEEKLLTEIKTEPEESTTPAVILDSCSLTQKPKIQFKKWNVLKHKIAPRSSPYTSLKPVKQSSRKKRKAEMPLSEMKNVKCQYCTEIFTSSTSLLPHIQESHCFACETCGVTFPYEITLILHKSEHSNRNQKTGGSPVSYIYKCSTCKLMFSTNESLTTHLKTKHDAFFKVESDEVKVEKNAPVKTYSSASKSTKLQKNT